MKKKKNHSKIEKMKEIKRGFAMIVLVGEILRILWNLRLLNMDKFVDVNPFEYYNITKRFNELFIVQLLKKIFQYFEIIINLKISVR